MPVAGTSRSDISDVHGGTRQLPITSHGSDCPAYSAGVAALATTGKISKPLITVAGNDGCAASDQAPGARVRSGGQQ